CGLFGFYRNTRMSAPVKFKADGIENLILSHRNQYNPDYPAVWQDDSFVLDSHFRMPGHGVAVYHNSRLGVGAFEINAGVRVDYEKVSLDYRNHAETGYDTYRREPDGTLVLHASHPLVVGGTGSLDRSFLQVLPKVSVSWLIPGLQESTLYATVSKGFKSGGFNTQMFSDVLQQDLMAKMGMSAPYDVDEVVAYRPEKSWNYELGAHVDLCDGMLRLDGAAFFIDCRDQQLTMFPAGSTTGRIMTNAGRTHSRGVEIAATVSPSADLTVNASWGYTHATFQEFNDGRSDYSGKRLPYAPANTLFVGAQYVVPFGKTDGLSSLLINVGLRGVGDIYWNEANTVRQPFYALLNAAVEYRYKNMSLRLWGENLTDKSYDTFYFVSIGNAFVQRGMPWRVGATFRINFQLPSDNSHM
ncbi:MAG: TonB-dependent receptor, partial [Muribaculaceae bacterium]|nr:TonB-dependent receptor [Muribaculaceae bacterium]